MTDNTNGRNDHPDDNQDGRDEFGFDSIDAVEQDDLADDGDAESAGGDPTLQMSPEEQIAILHGQLAEVEKARLMAVADRENLRKRMDREVRDARTFGISSFAEDIVKLTDTFQRAMQAVPTGNEGIEDPALKGLIEGVQLTEREFLNVLEKHGIKREDPKGEKFDPHLHQAMAQLQNPDLPAGTVMEVIQAGFTINGRVLRPAAVVVAQGGAKPVRASETATTVKAESSPAEAAVAEASVTESGPASPAASDAGVSNQPVNDDPSKAV